MNFDRHSEAESSAVRAALVADLAYSTLPSGIMGFTLVGIAAFGFLSTGSSALFVAVALGSLSSIAKVALTQLHKRNIDLNKFNESNIGHWELAHFATTAFVAVSVGITAGSIFMQIDLRLQMLATGLIFGYGSGIVSRVGIRPKIAVVALILATIPPIIAAASWNDSAHHVIVIVFAVFLLGSFDTVLHIYRTAVRHVTVRLQMATLAARDSLTGLANRSGLRSAFDAISPNDPVAVLCLDLDGFKSVNDRYGHAAGDALLKIVAERLLSVASANSTVVRMGGDEFVVLLPDMHRRDNIAELSQLITTILSEPFIIDAEKISISASVGHAASPIKPGDLDSLLRRADEASYRVKANRGNDMSINRLSIVPQNSIYD